MPTAPSRVFNGLSGTGYGEILNADNQIHDLSPMLVGADVSVVAYTCCNGQVLASPPLR